MKRENLLVSLTIQFPNPIQPPQWGAPVLITHVGVVLDVNGQAAYQPAYSQMPATADDITPDVLQAMQAQLAAVGLTITRIEEGGA